MSRSSALKLVSMTDPAETVSELFTEEGSFFEQPLAADKTVTAARSMAILFVISELILSLRSKAAHRADLPVCLMRSQDFRCGT